MKPFRFAAVALLVGAVPLLLILSNLRWMLLDQGFYERGFARQGVSQTTGMTREQLATAAGQIIAYFQDGPPVSLVVDKEWGREALFNERETIHLADVRGLAQLVFRGQALAAFLLGLGVILTLAERGPSAIRRLAGRLLAGGALTLLIFLGLLAGTLLDFPALFLQFHLLSFANDFWMLDPRTDYMIRMFPYGFWFDAAVTLVQRTVLGGGLLVVVSGALLYLGRRVGGQQSVSGGRMVRVTEQT